MEINRNSGTFPAWSWLSNSTISKFFISPTWLYIPQLQSIAIRAIVFSFHNFKILPTFYHKIFFRLVTSLFIMSIIITIVSNITELVLQNIIFSESFIGISSPHLPLSYYVLSRFICWFKKKMLDQTSIAVIRLFAKDNEFSKKIRFFLGHC